MNETRRQEALKVRNSVAKLASSRPHPRHIANDDEQKFRRQEKTDCGGEKNVASYLASYTKGMPHDEDSGLVLDTEDFKRFVKGIDSGDPRDFNDTKLGPLDYSESNRPWRSHKAKKLCNNKGAGLRAWESQGAGRTFDLEGPDAQAVNMPPAPALGSDELIAEIAEVYAQALLRDVPFTQIVDGSGKADCYKCKSDVTVKTLLKLLNKLDWFKSKDCCQLNEVEQKRKRDQLCLQNIFRGVTFGDDIGTLYFSIFTCW